MGCFLNKCSKCVKTFVDHFESRMSRIVDVAVIGLGAVGSAALYQLSKKGVSTAGFDQFFPPHSLGSSHGDTRITRQAIGEGAVYTPLALRSCEIWPELEEATGLDLLTITGGLIMASSRAEKFHSANFLGDTIRVADLYQISHEVIGVSKIRSRFPQFRLYGDERGYYEPGAGFLRPELCIDANLRMAKAQGARILFGEEVVAIQPSSKGVLVRTKYGDVYSAGKAILSVGPWIRPFLPKRFSRRFRVTRQVQHWFAPVEIKYETFLPGVFPVFIWGFPNGDWLYGFPAIGGKSGGVKFATSVNGQHVEPSVLEKPVLERESQDFYFRYLASQFPGINQLCKKSVACLYTKTPDSHFIIDTHPHHENIIIASPCSGHGFKHSAAVGEIISQIILGEPLLVDIAPFSFKRFQK